MRVVINEGHNALHKGETKRPGSILDLPDEDAKVLIKDGVASRASRTTPEDTGGPDAPDDAETWVETREPDPEPAPRPRQKRGRKRAK